MTSLRHDRCGDRTVHEYEKRNKNRETLVEHSTASSRRFCLGRHQLQVFESGTNLPETTRLTIVQAGDSLPGPFACRSASNLYLKPDA